MVRIKQLQTNTLCMCAFSCACPVRTDQVCRRQSRHSVDCVNLNMVLLGVLVTMFPISILLPVWLHNKFSLHTRRLTMFTLYMQLLGVPQGYTKQEDWSHLHEILEPVLDVSKADRTVRVVSKVACLQSPFAACLATSVWQPHGQDACNFAAFGCTSAGLEVCSCDGVEHSSHAQKSKRTYQRPAIDHGHMLAAANQDQAASSGGNCNHVPNQDGS